jgi:hypothetical protein
VAGDFSIGGDFPQGGNEEFAPEHVRGKLLSLTC